MAVIKSGATSDVLTVDPTSKAARVTIYDSAGNQGASATPISVVLTGQPITATTSPAKKATYRVVYKAQTPLASATVPAMTLKGSATKTIKIIGVRISGTAGTGGVADVWTAKFTTVTAGTDIGGVSISKADSNDAAATAVTAFYSVAPTGVTLADGYWTSERYEWVTPAVTVLPQVVDLHFGTDDGTEAMTLRGTGQWFGIGFSSVATSPTANIEVEFTEE